MYGKYIKLKCDALLNAFKRKASSKVHLTQPTGGMFAWMTMPDTVNCDEFFEACMNRNVGIIKCGAFAADGVQNGHAFRLSYTVPTVPRNYKGHGNSWSFN